MRKYMSETKLYRLLHKETKEAVQRNLKYDMSAFRVPRQYLEKSRKSQQNQEFHEVERRLLHHYCTILIWDRALI